MSKDDWIYVGHMLEMSRKAINAAQNKTREEYDRDDVLVMALAHFIQVVGEAAGKVSNEFQEKNSQIPWHQIIGMRHRIVHDYMNVDEDVLWEVVNHDLPTLIQDLGKLVPPES